MALPLADTSLMCMLPALRALACVHAHFLGVRWLYWCWLFNCASSGAVQWRQAKLGLFLLVFGTGTLSP